MSKLAKQIFVVIIILLICATVQTYWPFRFLALFFGVVDTYIRIIFISWPAVVLILGVLILFKHKEALDNLLNRIIKGPGGTEFSPPEQSQLSPEKLQNEVKEKEEINREAESKPDESKVSVLQAENTKLREDLVKESKKRLFERIYTLIFGSQIKILLEMIKKDGTIFVTDAFKFFREGIGGNPELKDYDFVKYLYFLKNVGLIQSVDLLENSSTITITENGKEFLTYLALEKLDMNKPL